MGEQTSEHYSMSEHKDDGANRVDAAEDRAQNRKTGRQTADPLERLRYVRNQMDSKELPDLFRWWPAGRIAAWISALIAVALLVWRIR